jgi:signal transduction histidine kinase
MECRIYRASDSALRWISSQGETFRDENGKPIRMMGAVVDITERKEREEQDRLVAVIKEREDFMATLTHDMKNPIIAANRLLEMFVSGNLGELTEQQQEIMQCMFDSNVGVLKLIANLTDVYRLEKNVNSLVLSDVNLSLLLSSFANRMKHFAELRHVKIIAEIPSAPQEVQADRVQIERVFQNLLDNALKFSPSGGTVRIVMSMTEHHHIIEVEDNGPGIAADELPLLFKRFSQGRAGKRYTGGSGLGLYLCKQIVEAHGGTIDCQSQVAQYTKFRVCLPAGHSAGLAGAQENHHE